MLIDILLLLLVDFLVIRILTLAGDKFRGILVPIGSFVRMFEFKSKTELECYFSYYLILDFIKISKLLLILAYY